MFFILISPFNTQVWESGEPHVVWSLEDGYVATAASAHVSALHQGSATVALVAVKPGTALVMVADVSCGNLPRNKYTEKVLHALANFFKKNASPTPCFIYLYISFPISLDIDGVEKK